MSKNIPLRENRTLRYDTVAQYCAYEGFHCQHPYVSCVVFDNNSYGRMEKIEYGLFGLFICRTKSAKLIYNDADFEYEPDTLVGISPGQSMQMRDYMDNIKLNARGVVFSSDIFTDRCEKYIKREFKFFEDWCNVGLSIDSEEILVFDKLFDCVDYELAQPSSKSRDNMLRCHLNSILFMSKRLFNKTYKDYISRKDEILHQFIRNIDRSFMDENRTGIPSVSYFAEKAGLGRSNFSNIINFATGGQSPQRIISERMFRYSKSVLEGASDIHISELAYKLGFSSPNHFSRFFKRMSGETPLLFRNKIQQT